MVAGGRQLLYAERVYTSTTGIGARSHGHPHNPRTNSCQLDRTSEESAAVGVPHQPDCGRFPSSYLVAKDLLPMVSFLRAARG